jgi:hypothetical protein
MSIVSGTFERAMNAEQKYPSPNPLSQGEGA